MFPHPGTGHLGESGGRWYVSGIGGRSLPGARLHFRRSFARFQQIARNCYVISSVEITRLRGIREGKLDNLTPLVVLVGPNGCGKSTVLDALLIGAMRDNLEELARAVQRHRGVKYGARWLFWKTGSEGASQVTVGISDTARRHFTLVPKSADDGQRLDIEIEVRQPRENLSDAIRSVVSQFGPGNNLECVSWNSAPLSAEFPHVRLFEGHREDPKRPLHRLFSEAVTQGGLEQAKAIITDLASDVTDVPLASEVDDPLVFFSYGNRGVPAALSGDGLYSLLRLSLELATHPNGTVLLEEPEVHQHPGAIRQSVRAILAAVRRDIQVVITTHSLELIDSILAEATEEDIERLSLYRLELENGRLISNRMPGSDVAFSRTEIESDLR